MDDAKTKDLVKRILREVKRPDSDKLELPVEDIQGLRQITNEIIRLTEQGSRKRWGPNLRALNGLSKLLLTDEQFEAMGTRKGDVAKAILQALSPVTDLPESEPARKRVRFDDEEEFIVE